jgi:endonuclease G
MSQPFGKFPSLSAFLEAYKAQNKEELLREALTAPPDLAARRIRRIQRERRDLVEVNTTIVKVEEDDSDVSGGKHHRLTITIKEVLTGDPDVADDLDDAVDNQRSVFLAIRFGDAMGIREQMEGLKVKGDLHARGEWITRNRAKDHGGERISVLHFTHHPIGFICTKEHCYA